MLSFRMFVGIVFLFGSFHIAFSKTSFNVNQNIIYDENIFRNYEAVSDWIYETYFSSGWRLQKKSLNTSVDYRGSITGFTSFPERFFHSHQIGAQIDLPIKSKMNSNFGIFYRLRKNKPDYKLYDFSYLNLSSSFRWNQWENNPIDLIYNFRRRVFPEFSELSYRENFVSFRMKHFFITRTTFIAELELSTKTYLNDQVYESTVINEITIKENEGNGRRGRGNGRSGETTIADTATVLYNLGTRQNSHARLILRLAQSLFPKTGLSLAYIRQFPPSGASRYLAAQEYIYSDDNLLYDDPYTFRSQEFLLSLNQLLPWQSRVKLNFDYEQRKYFYPIFSHPVEELNPEKRVDHQTTVSFYWQKPFRFIPWVNAADLYFAYDFILNQSNELYFDYQSSIFQIGLDLMK